MEPNTLIPSKKPTARQAWALLCALVMVGCATPRSIPEGMDDPPPPAGPVAAEFPPEPLDLRSFVAQYSNPVVCERQARRYLSVSRDDAWAALKACVEGTHFTQIQALLSRAWAQEIRSRPEAAALIARVVALRGGSVEGDLRLLHEQKLPIFSLASAIAQPDTYKGRYILVRAQVGDSRTDGQKPTVWLVEQDLGSVSTEQQVGLARRRDSVFTTSSNVGGEKMLGSGTEGGTISQSEGTRRSHTTLHYDNISTETGREALGRLAKADPFLAPGRDFIILARFDGMRTTSGALDEDDDGPRIPVLSIVGYFIPHPLIVY